VWQIKLVTSQLLGARKYIIKENLGKSAHAVFDICQRTGRHTDTLIAKLLTPKGGEVINLLQLAPNRIWERGFIRDSGGSRGKASPPEAGDMLQNY